MRRAHELARQAQTIAPPNPAVGCVIVRDGRELGAGHTQRTGGPHAEIEALASARSAVAGAAAQRLEGATAYVTLEPCCHQGRTGPCTDALIAAGVTRVVIAATDADPRVAGQGIEHLRAAGIDVVNGVLPAPTRWLNRGFFCRLQQARPWVRVKLASSLDGRTAMATGESKWITGSAARQDVQLLRAQSDCILTGSGTVLHDDPSLDVRATATELGIEGPVRQPVRAVVDSQLRTPIDARLFATGGPVRLYTRDAATTEAAATRLLQANSAPRGASRMGDHGLAADLYGDRVQVFTNHANAEEGVDLDAVLRDLARIPVNLVHVEAGATLCGALLQAGLVDEIVMYLAPHLMGNQGRAQFVLPEIATMQDRIGLHLDTVEQVGDDVRLCLRPSQSPYAELARAL